MNQNNIFKNLNIQNNFLNKKPLFKKEKISKIKNNNKEGILIEI